MKCFSLSAPFLQDPFLVQVVRALEKEFNKKTEQTSSVARIVGGAVRNSLLGLPVKDIDLATRTTPEETQVALAYQQLKTIPTGLAHGTIRVLAKGQGGEVRSCEITTLRYDAETFGRHARVAYTQDWHADACRRDFTVNALYLDLDGTGYDYTQGLADLRRGRLRFIGDPEQRIHEDYLRILRLFRLYAQYPSLEPDEASWRICTRTRAGLSGLSGERVREELLSLLGGKGVGRALRLMMRAQVLDEFKCGIALSEEAVARLERMVELEEFLGENTRDPERGLVFLVKNFVAENAIALGSRLKLSRRQQRRLLRLSEFARDLQA